MPKRRYWLLGLAAVALASFPLSVRAGEKMTDSSSKSSVAGWQEFIDSLQSLPDRMLAKLPEEQRKDPQVQQEVGRLALEALTNASLEGLAGDGDSPQFVASIGQILNVGQPNADTVYRTAWITPGASYRMRGKAGTLNQAVIAQFLPPGAPGSGAREHLHLSSLKQDANGRYDLLIGPEKPAGYQGDWWQLDPHAIRLMIRMVSMDWAKEESPTLSIERVDKPAGRPRPSAAFLEQRLRTFPRQMEFMALMFVDHVEQLRQEGYVNKLKVFDVGYGALAGQFYYEGPYDLADDEALVIDSPVPKTCNYRSLILTNEIYETIDWYNNHSSLNGAQADVDTDGRLRVVVSARDPGVKNWLDTSGYPRGMIQGRWTGCDSQPIPEVHKVKLSELKTVLPKDTASVTPEERQAIIRERRRALQERPLW